MERATKFLLALSKALSVFRLYREGHPAREGTIDQAYQELTALQEERAVLQFTFIGGEIVLDRRPLRGLKLSDWGSRLSAAGVQQLEFMGPVTRDDFDVFLEGLHARISGETMETSGVRRTRPTQIRFGSAESEGRVRGTGDLDRVAEATLTYTFSEEVEAAAWLHSELKMDRDLHMVEVEAVVRSLSLAMHGDQSFLIPLLRLKDFDQYTTAHAMNVSVLAMALSEFIGLGAREVKKLGIAGLLHDLGKVKIPDEILNKPGKLTDEERAIMNSHPVEGARLILATEEQLDLAAVVAYEHHIRLDGGGYPILEYPRKCHQASDLVHVCDVYDALRTKRPYRDAWETDRVLSHLEEGAGSEFDPELALAFCQMMRRRETRVAELGSETQPIPLGQGVETAGDDRPPSESEAPDPPPATDSPQEEK